MSTAIVLSHALKSISSSFRRAIATSGLTALGKFEKVHDDISNEL